MSETAKCDIFYLSLRLQSFSNRPLHVFRRNRGCGGSRSKNFSKCVENYSTFDLNNSAITRRILTKNVSLKIY